MLRDLPRHPCSPAAGERARHIKLSESYGEGEFGLELFGVAFSLS